jgi:hypothetical protein
MPFGAIRILLAALGDGPHSLVEKTLTEANSVHQAQGTGILFEVESVSGRGIEILRRAEHADVVVFNLKDGDLPGEASYIGTSCPSVKIIGVDDNANVGVVLGSVREPLSRDLPSVIRWITRRIEEGPLTRR